MTSQHSVFAWGLSIKKAESYYCYPNWRGKVIQTNKSHNFFYPEELSKKSYPNTYLTYLTLFIDKKALPKIRQLILPYSHCLRKQNLKSGIEPEIQLSTVRGTTMKSGFPIESSVTWNKWHTFSCQYYFIKSSRKINNICHGKVP